MITDEIRQESAKINFNDDIEINYIERRWASAGNLTWTEEMEKEH
jgi:hypothetical protein